MIDHGGDIVTVVANAAADITKGVMQISAVGLKQLFLLMYEGRELKVGETNIERLIKALDAGDKISDITIPKEHINQLVELSRKHGVTYAVAENSEKQMIVYFPESQSNRMTNVLSDVQKEINKDKTSVEEFNPEIKQSLYTEDIDGERTVVFFDGMNPKQHVHISQQPLKEGGCETRCFLHSEDGITELSDVATATEESYKYKQRETYEVTGIYPESKIQNHIDKVCLEMEQQRKNKEIITVRENMVDNLISKSASLDGALHTISDSGKPGNMITIYKHLERGAEGEFKTINEILVYKDGALTNNITPREAILSYDKYKIGEKHGKSALTQYEKIMSGKAFEKGSKTNKEQPEVLEGERKPLVEYEKEIEKIREAMPPKPEKTEVTIEMPLASIKNMTEKNER